jgi:hypothetical protein
VVHKTRVAVLGTAAAAVVVVALLAFLPVSTPEPARIAAPVAAPASPSPAAAADAPALPVKRDNNAEPVRAKPSPDPAPAPDRRSVPVSIPTNAPDFLVADPGGYAHQLAEFRGKTVLIAVWNPDEAESIAAIERLYKTHSANPKFRLLGVSSDQRTRPVNATFPVFYNQGSRLLGLQPGDFLLLDENGSVQLRGSLLKDVEGLSKLLREK